ARFPFAGRHGKRFWEAAADAGVVNAHAVVGIRSDEALDSGEEDVLAAGGGIDEHGAADRRAGADQLELAGAVFIDVRRVVGVGGRQGVHGSEEHGAVVEQLPSEIRWSAGRLFGKAIRTGNGRFARRPSPSGSTGCATELHALRVEKENLCAGVPFTLVRARGGVVESGQGNGRGESEVATAGRDSCG